MHRKNDAFVLAAWLCTYILPCESEYVAILGNIIIIIITGTDKPPIQSTNDLLGQVSLI